MAQSLRAHNRAHDQIRPVQIQYDPFGYGAASVLLHVGNTKVLCTVTMQPGVPPFLKGKKVGWLQAEYAMLPTATKQRTQRAANAVKKQGRSIEISRLIGRSLRTITKLDHVGERTITVDCDILQADGGTRTAALTAASIALTRAQERWLAKKQIDAPILREQLAAVSVGTQADQVFLDIDFAEDSTLDSDFNFVLTRSGDIIEIQGTAERMSISWQQFQAVAQAARSGVQQLFKAIELAAKKETKERRPSTGGMFSLQNRLKQESAS